MFKDMNVSKDLISDFNKVSKIYDILSYIQRIQINYIIKIIQESEYTSRIGNISLYVNVLTSGFWPSYPQSTYNMPQEV